MDSVNQALAVTGEWLLDLILAALITLLQTVFVVSLITFISAILVIAFDRQFAQVLGVSFAFAGWPMIAYRR